MTSVQPAAGAGAAPSTHPYTCNTCQVAYRNIDLQKTHMKSDWHRYNLKRRVATLPPISAEVFTEKVLQARATTTAETEKAYFEKSCEACNKTYYSENAYQNHILSQKHKQNEATAGPRNEEETKSVVSSTFSLGESIPAAKNGVDSDAEDEFNQVIEGLQKAKLSQQRPSPVKRPNNPRPVADEASEDADDAATETETVNGTAQEPTWTLNSCLFCNFESPSVALNAQHMEKIHGMFIPEKPYLTDLDGLVQQLQSKIGEGRACLFCDKVKASVYAVQTHMRDTGHCKIPYSTEEEQLDIGDFYDFRSTYSDPEESDSDEETGEDNAGGARVSKPKAKRESKEDEDADGDGWETDSSASSLDSADLTAVPAEGHYHQYDRLSKHPHHAHDDPRPRHQADGWHSRAHKHTHAVFYDDYELHLPSGKSVGHRSLNKYFRQNLTNYPTAEERAERLAIEGSERRPGSDDEDDGRMVRRERGRGRAGAVVPRGTAGLIGASDEAKKAVRKEEVRARKLENYQTKKRSLAYGENNNNQKHYYYRYDGGG
ncbi:hypothetical protein NLG97_g1370 [Lecanicillium saksenae]|uniref:Uncharacterized protein n=1 Tax=Lecanicillium saksenae TaxID=468837 RepID=A0ACC1R5V7_9HYPO|nr:hypothetical protein NLG97_g1370 [Lecanicillium saksenae]